MRFLLTCQPGPGHVHPVLPLGRALADAGHDVTVATASAYRATIERAGLTHLRAGLEWDEADLLGTMPDVAAVPVVAQADWILRTVFCDRGPKAMLPDLLEHARTWRPDVVVTSQYELGGIFAAEELGVPHAAYVLSLRLPPGLRRRVLTPAWRRLREELGMPRDDAMAAWGTGMTICPMPVGWTFGRAMTHPVAVAVTARSLPRRPGTALRAALLQGAVGAEALLTGRRGERLGPDELHVRPPAGAPAGTPKPACLEGLREDRPIVYVSLGTVFATQFPDVFDHLVAALRDAPVNAVVTLGRDGDPSRFGDLPDHLRIERFVPQAELLPHVDLVVSHAGYGTVIEPLVLGIPQVVLPLSADQPVVAMLALGRGIAVAPPVSALRVTDGLPHLPVVDPARLTPDLLRRTVLGALEDEGLRRRAREVADEVALLPGLDVAAERLAGLVREPVPAAG